MDIKNESQRGGASEERDIASEEKSSSKKGELYVEKTEADLTSDVEGEEIESYGVYMQGKDKTILGQFWNEDLANLFLNSLSNSEEFKRIKKSGI